MKWKANHSHPEGWKFNIEYELEIAITKNGPTDFPTYTLVVTNANDGLLYHYMQEELEAAIQQAHRKWGVPEDSWVKVEE